jgi:hypothetical protein
MAKEIKPSKDSVKIKASSDSIKALINVEYQELFDREPLLAVMVQMLIELQKK